mgnify:CR=1 FL=1
MDTRSTLLGFIKDELARGTPDVDVESDSLIETGIIDSVGIMKLVDFIESKFSVKISDDELLPESFDTVDDITKLVDSKAS